MIPFGQWLPDLAALGSPGTPDAVNVRPTLDGFRSVHSLAIGTTALDNAPRGAFATFNGVAYNYAGDSGKLYQLESAAWADQSKAGGYTLGPDEYWEFAKWLDTVIAVGGINATSPVSPQVITLGTVSTTQFEDLAGNPPQARHIGIIRGFVVLGNVYESGQELTQRLRWSGISDPTFWEVDAAKQSDFQDLKGSGGAIQAVKGGEYGVIVQEKSIRRMDYTGAKVVFAIEETLPGVGTPAPRSVVRYGDHVFFLGRSGFQAVREGSAIDPIGADKVDRTFYRSLAGDFVDRVVGALDRVNEQIVWIYPGQGSSLGQPNAAIIFDMKSNSWGNFQLNVEWIYDGLSPGTTLESLDAVYPTLESVPASLDSAQWEGGAAQLFGFDALYRSGSFDGLPLETDITTREQMISAGRTHVNKARPDVDAVQNEPDQRISISAGVRDNIGDRVLWTVPRLLARDGNGSVRSKGYYHRFKVNIPGIAFDRARGVTVTTARPTGKR